MPPIVSPQRMPLDYNQPWPERPATATATAAAASTHPFKLVKVRDGGTLKVRVLYGTVAGGIPTGMSLGDDPPYLLTASGTQRIFLIVTTHSTTGAVTSRTIGHNSSMPSNSDGTYYQEIGSYSVSGDDLSLGQAIGGSQAFELCGGPGGVPLWGLV